ncbi:Reverse transcriptase domain-containing protein, partial [Aphis craccivora]
MWGRIIPSRSKRESTRIFAESVQQLNRDGGLVTEMMAMFNNTLEFIHKRSVIVESRSFQNVRGLNTKLDVFSRNITLANYDIIVLTETWLRHEVSDCELGLLPNYIIFRCDRCSDFNLPAIKWSLSNDVAVPHKYDLILSNALNFKVDCEQYAL